MPRFGARSREELSTCHHFLRELFEVVVSGFDCKVIEGHRDETTQNLYFSKGKSKLRWPDGKHNKEPSMAADVAPYPINWNDIPRFYYFAGYVKGIARMMNIPIRWGGDWDDDTQTNDQRFKDLVHFELPIIGNKTEGN